jgi:phosphoglycolate phosphatase
MTARVVLFDFDGTIADTYQAIANITNQLSSEFGYKPLDEEELLLLKNLSSRDIVKRTEISIFKIPFLVKRVRKELSKEIAYLKPIFTIDKTLLELKDRGYTLGIVTSNVKENVELFLAKNNLDNLFSYIYSSTSIFGKHRIISQVIRQYKLNHSEVIYIGDETRDIRAARKSQIGIIAVSWGFNSDAILAEYEPDFLVHHPEKLTQAITKYYQYAVKNSIN